MLSWKGFQKAFEYINLIEQGMVCTLSLSALTVLFGFILALFLAICRLSNFKPAKYLATVYVEVIRATPMLVQLFIVYNICWPVCRCPGSSCLASFGSSGSCPA